MNAPMGFSKEQQAYFQGLVLGTDVARKINNLPVLSGSGATNSLQIGASQSAPPVAKGQLTSLHALAQQRCESSGKKLAAEELAKRDKDALEMWSEIRARAEKGVADDHGAALVAANVAQGLHADRLVQQRQ